MPRGIACHPYFDRNGVLAGSIFKKEHSANVFSFLRRKLKDEVLIVILNCLIKFIIIVA